MTEYGRRAIQNTTIFFLLSIISALSAYLLRFFLARKLTVAEYGLFFALISFINILALFKDLGLGYALLRFIPELQVKNKLEEIKSLIIASSVLQLISSTTITLIIIYFAESLAQNFFRTTNTTIIYIFAIIFFVSFPQNIVSICFQAFQRTTLFAVQDLTRNILVLLITIILFSLGFSIASPALSYLLMYILVFILFFHIFTKKIFKEFWYLPVLIRNHFSNLIIFGFPAMLTIFGNNLLQYTDTIMLTYLTDLEKVGLYQIAIPLTTIIFYFAHATSSIITPMVSELHTLNKMKELQNGIKLLHKYLFIITTPLATYLFLFPEFFITLFFGEKFLEATIPLQILSVGIIFYTIAYTNLNIIFGLGKPKSNTYIMITTALINITLNFILIPEYKIIGAAIATTTSYFIMLLISSYEIRKITKNQEYLITWIKILPSTALFVLITYFFKNLLMLNPLPEFIISLIIGISIYSSTILISKTITLNELFWILSQLGLRRTK